MHDVSPKERQDSFVTSLLITVTHRAFDSNLVLEAQKNIYEIIITRGLRQPRKRTPPLVSVE